MKTLSAAVVGALLCGSAWAADYELKADKATYAPGETVTLQFTNNSASSVILGSFWPTIYNEGGGIVYSPVTILPVTAVGAGQSHPAEGWKWNQLDNDDKWVPAGKYTAKLKGSPPLNEFLIQLETSFMIEGPAVSGGFNLTTDMPVYKSGVAGSVKITLISETSQAAQLISPSPWSIYQGSQLVHTHSALAVLVPLAPGTSKAWTWNKTTTNGTLVPAGTYTIKVGPIHFGNGSSLILSRTIALTKTGKLAGKSMFPLSVGNQWQYRTTPPLTDPIVTRKVTGSTVQGMAVWYKLTNLIGDHSVRLVGSSKPILKIATPSAGVTDLFRFGQPKGHSYNVNGFFWISKMMVEETNGTVVTPAGTFKGCYRLDVVETMMADAGYDQFWFAPGIGLVQYSQVWFGGSRIYALQSATLKGTDGKVYTIGAK